MDTERLFKLALAAFLMATVIGCNDIGNNDGSNGPNPPTHPPDINMVELVVNDYWIDYPYEAYVGDRLVAMVTFCDRDTDLRTLYINYYHESDGFTTPLTIQQALIPPTNTKCFKYEFVDDNYTVAAPTGFWRIRFYAVDEAGNESNEYEVSFLVRP